FRSGEIYKSNVYEPRYLAEIDRVVNCQSLETMFANKLVAVQDRWLKRKKIVGRDIYDIHHFFYRGYSYSPDLIKERTGMEPLKYLEWLGEFIDGKLTNQIIDEDLNMLLTHEQFQNTRKSLKQEVLMFLTSRVKLPY
ncbi:MAG: nucleotidyl transferase AbiEii/AbiGii toxin family protein, partial [Patescibacteria group bacterium]